jgi:uncharacterized protein (UPF0335 family)
MGIVQRIERLDAEIEALNGDKSEVYKEAKATGFDVPALRIVIRDRARHAKDPNKAKELEAIADSYRAAVGLA